MSKYLHLESTGRGVVIRWAEYETTGREPTPDELVEIAHRMVREVPGRHVLI